MEAETPIIEDVVVNKPKRKRTPRAEGDKPKPKRGKKKDKEKDPLQDTSAFISTETLPPPAVQNQKPVILEDKPPVKRSTVIIVTLDQKGILKGNELVDPHNNTLKEIKVEIEGEIMDIAKIAGRVANSLFDFYQSLKGVKGIQRGVGFNVNLMIQDNTTSKEGSVKITSVSKVRMSNPVDIAFKIGQSILTELEADNSDGLMTGSFAVSKSGEFMLRKLKFNETVLNLPLHVIKEMMNQKRLDINKNVRENKKASL